MFSNTVTHTDMDSDDKRNDNHVTITAVQCRMARAAVTLGIRELAKLADVSPNTIARLERGEELKESTIAAIRAALEDAGVEFIDQNGGGAGVRLVKSEGYTE